MVQWIRALAAKPDDLILISRTHALEGKNRLPKLSPDLHICAMIHVHTH